MPPGSIVITHNPVTKWENYHLTLSAARGDFMDYVDDDRSMGGYWSCAFKMVGRSNVLKDFFKNGLGRDVKVFGSGMELLHEGFVYEMIYNFPPDQYIISLKNMLNRIWMRADYDADGEVERSTTLQNLDSQARFGIKEQVISGGQIDSLAVADQAAQAFIDLRGFPQPQVDRGRGRGEPYLEIFSKGYIETLSWRVFNCADVGTQGSSAEVEDIVGHRASVRVIKPTIWDQEFDEQIADFNAISPTWDKHNPCEAAPAPWGFDAVVDADGDMARAAAAKHDGTFGIEYTFDDANPAYGTLNFAAIDQTSAVAAFWFNKNDVTGNDGLIILVSGRDGGAIERFRILYLPATGAMWFQANDDTAGNRTVVNITPSVGYHHYLLYWKAGSAPFADDGIFRVYQDFVHQGSLTDIDNDGRDVDYVRFGIGWSNTTVGFGGSLYMDEIYIDPIGAPMVNTLAARNGTYGLVIPIMDTTSRYGEFTGPINEAEITAETWFSPKSIAMAADDEFVHVALREDVAGVDVARINLLYNGTNYALRIEAREDGGAYVVSNAISIANHYGHARLVLIVSSGAGNDDGYLFLYWNDIKIAELSGLDNDTLNVDRMLPGAVSGLDAGTYGLIYLDDVRWSDDAVVTRTAESGVGQFVAGLEIATNDTLVTTELDADRRALDIIFDLAKLGDAGNNRWLVYMTRGRILHFAQAAPAVEVV